MKQLTMTPELSKLIKDRVGQDVDPEGFAVFEAIALNSKPLPGKDGTVHEDARVTALTLSQMADHIAVQGKHLPLVSDHQLMGEPKGRVFDAKTFYTDDGEVELRVLLYLDATEERLIAKLNAGSLDELSVSFLPTQFLCSECGWDYFSAEATWEHLLDRTCKNGHTIGDNGIHARLVGLSEFIEVSLVSRGAADEPKILGQSQSRLHSATALKLEARGYEESRLLVQASKGVKKLTDTTKLVTDLSEARANVIVLTQERDGLKTQVTELTSERDSLTEQVTQLTSERDEAREGSRADEADSAIEFLQGQFKAMTVALKGEDAAEGDVPATVAELVKACSELSSELTAIIPTGGRSQNDPEPQATRKVFPAAFSIRNLKD